MKKFRTSIKLLYLLISVLLLACNKDDDQPTPDDSGYLSMNVSISVASESASGRTTTGNVDDFFIAVYDINDVLIVSYEKLSEAPPEIELITGEYYVVAHSDNQEEAAFDNPYYYGRSDNFTIDKEELKTIDIVAELANSKVSIHYSDILIETFDSYSGSVEVVSSGTKLNYNQGETREGYFLPEPLYVEVNLSYSKLDGSYITRTFTANIDAQPKTLYKVMVDASLANGKIVFNLIVDDSFEEEVIEIGEESGDSFARMYGGSLTDNGYDIINTLDGGMLLTGMSYSNDGDVQSNFGDKDIWLVKINVSGDIEWAKNYGSIQQDISYKTMQYPDGNYLVGGIQYVPSESNNVYLIKLDPSGNIIWEKSFGTPANEGIHDMDLTDDGGCVLTGSITVNSSFNLLVTKVDLNGNQEWTVNYGGSGYDTGRGILQDDDGNYVVVGSAGIIDGDVVGADSGHTAWMLKLDVSGNIIWQSTFGGSGIDGINSVVKNNVGFVLAGSTDSSELPGYKGSTDLWVIQTDDFGNMIWNKVLGGSGYDYMGGKISLSDDGGILIAALSDSNDGDVSLNYGGFDFWALKLDVSGNIIWETTIGGEKNETPYGILEADNGYHYIIGYSNSEDSSIGGTAGSYGDDFLLVVLDPNGNF